MTAKMQWHTSNEQVTARNVKLNSHVRYCACSNNMPKCLHLALHALGADDVMWQTWLKKLTSCSRVEHMKWTANAYQVITSCVQWTIAVITAAGERTHLQTSVYMCTASTYVHKCIYVYRFIYIYIYTCVYIYVYTHTLFPARPLQIFCESKTRGCESQENADNCMCI